MGIFDELLRDPKATLLFLAIALPGRMLAISIHEAAHGWVAERCGDGTARRAGRITLNPLRHIDPFGIAMMLLIGIGWAKPVPVNPANFRSYRRDDLLVSLAGITANICLFLICSILLYGVVGGVLADMPKHDSILVAIADENERFLTEYKGQNVFCWLEGDGFVYVPLSDMLTEAPYYADLLIKPAYGTAASVLYQMLGYCMITNIMLAIFNLFPVPPLDGYHVLNDLLLKRSLFTTRKLQMAGMGLMYVLMFTGVLGKALNAVSTFLFGVVGGAAGYLYGLAGIL